MLADGRATPVYKDGLASIFVASTLLPRRGELNALVGLGVIQAEGGSSQRQRNGSTLVEAQIVRQLRMA